ncbi:MAG: GNAT family N-acetyltransferase [Alphaproteobacteria bacterium]|jgi:GNAT superfamily N-acetyltransferase|nr:GNAT family N-acetyltransferase [Alphaproteobacteria bacterium]
MSEPSPAAAEVLVRGMEAADLPSAGPLLRQLGYDVAGPELRLKFDAVQGADGHALFVAEIDDRIVALMHVFARPALEKPLEAIVQALVVDDACRGCGVGRRMMAVAERWAVDRGYRSLSLSSQVDRDDAHAFYQALGYGISSTAHTLRKRIDP